jgi:hypothetical protein
VLFSWTDAKQKQMDARNIVSRSTLVREIAVLSRVPDISLEGERLRYARDRQMAQPTPTIEAFRTIFRRPSLGFAEVTWRWTFGAAGWALLTLSLLEYLNTLPVTSGDVLFLRSRHPFLVSQAVAHIIAGSGERVVAAAVIVGIALVILWIICSSVGRAATIRPLLDHFAALNVPSSPSIPGAFTVAQESKPWHLRLLFGLNFLRVTLVLAGLLSLISSSIIAGLVSTPAHPRPGLSFLIFLPLAVMVVLFWSSMNWFLSIASIFVLRDGSDVLDSLASAVEFCLRRARAVSWSSTVFGTCHLVVFMLASSAIVFPMAFVGILPSWVILGAVILLTLAYFVVVDFFYVGRLAAYVRILETPEAVYSVSPPPTPETLPPLEQATGSHATISASISEHAAHDSAAWPPIPASDDDILSDVPLPPPESPES